MLLEPGPQAQGGSFKALVTEALAELPAPQPSSLPPAVASAGEALPAVGRGAAEGIAALVGRQGSPRGAWSLRGDWGSLPPAHTSRFRARDPVTVTFIRSLVISSTQIRFAWQDPADTNMLARANGSLSAHLLPALSLLQ